MKNLFISRSLHSDSLFWKFKDAGYNIIDQSLIDIKAITVINWPETDWVFFYSQKAIFYYFQQNAYSREKKYGVMSSGSAKEFEIITSFKPDFTGQGNAQFNADSLNILCQGKSILIPKAVHSIHALKDKISSSIKIETVDIYSNSKLDDFDIPECKILVFTSPLNVEAYFERYAFTGQKMFAIGSTTAEKIEAICNLKIPYCLIPSEDNLYHLVRDQLDLD